MLFEDVSNESDAAYVTCFWPSKANIRIDATLGSPAESATNYNYLFFSVKDFINVVKEGPKNLEKNYPSKRPQTVCVNAQL